MAAGPASCRYPGRAVGRQRSNRGCTARCDCARSSVSAVRDGTATVQWRHSDRWCFRWVCGRFSGIRTANLANSRCRVPVSLAALAAVALPGVGGLVILTAAGVRVGYRQAKAGFALRTAGIARFARPGAVPLGVVRSGSLVVVRPRALRVVRPGALSAGCLLDKVA